ncbi:MAG: hypothetical protein M1834_001219 [Cirrosporium novae-zelandiae]|nr:MAG: hypothetical protein M1834_001219 [Cirrosporium novae-zelandiae]
MACMISGCIVCASGVDKVRDAAHLLVQTLRHGNGALDGGSVSKHPPGTHLPDNVDNRTSIIAELSINPSTPRLKVGKSTTLFELDPLVNLSDMPSKATMSVLEIRKAAKEAKRDRDAKTKWGLGERPMPGRQYWNEIPDTVRPMKPESASVKKAIKRSMRSKPNKANHGNRLTIEGDIAEVTSSDTSTDEDINEASAAPEPDAGIMYSFDAAQGPGRGSQILSTAVAEAVDRFEKKQTEKLIKEEYEVITKDVDSETDGYTADEDDFELVF